MMAPARDAVRTPVAVASILAAGYALRLYKLTAVALWFDESISVALTSYPWREMLARAAEDIGPPLYFVVLKLWIIALGDSVVALRALSLTFSVVAVWVGYFFVREAFGNRRMALIAALF